jgi:hypothetical protein
MNKEERFKQMISGAQALILNEDFNEKVEQRAAKESGRIYTPKTQKPSASEQFAIPTNTPSSRDFINEEAFEKLPPAIRESFKKTPPIQINSPSGGILDSIASDLAIKPAAIAQPQQLNEHTSYTPNTSIDYNYIKYLIDESISKHITSIKESLLNESTLRGVKISNGNKIQVLDSKGNLYEGLLKLKKKKES